MASVFLADRGVVQVAGADARAFLQGLLTCDMNKVTPDRTAYGALLTPQGKIVFDFIVGEEGGAFQLDCPLTLAPELARRLGFYRLRANVQLSDESSNLGVVAVWGEGDNAPKDPRDARLGARRVRDRASLGEQPGDKALATYEALRISLGVPKGGVDFEYGQTFPHDANLDLLHGIDFRKGCYVGQEVVSRVEHRGSARRRIVKVAFSGPAPAPGSPILAAGATIGVMGSSSGQRGLAAVRTDRFEALQAEAAAMMCGDIVLERIIN